MKTGLLYTTSAHIAIAESCGSVHCIDRRTLRPTAAPPALTALTAQRFEHVLGAFFEGDRCCVALSTGSAQCAAYGAIRRVTSFTVAPVSSPGPSRAFVALLTAGLRQCDMYFSPEFDLSVNHQSRALRRTYDEYKWNFTAVAQLLRLFAGLRQYAYVVAGFVAQSGGAVLISRKSRFNAGVHYWSRGCDSDGAAAAFYETEELLIDGSRARAFVLLRGSVPAHWTQNPPADPQRPFVFGAAKESRRRFDLHFDRLSALYGERVTVCALTNAAGRERVLTETLRELCAARGVDFAHTEYSAAQFSAPALAAAVRAYAPRVSWFEEDSGAVLRAQEQFIRVSCASCMDRTNSFQFHIAELFASHFNGGGSSARALMWTAQHDALCGQYCNSRGVKHAVVLRGRQTRAGAVLDNLTLLRRQLSDVLVGGYLHDAYCVVRQSPRIAEAPHRDGFFARLLALVVLVAVCVSLLLRGQRAAAGARFRRGARRVISCPQIAPVEDADCDAPIV